MEQTATVIILDPLLVKAWRRAYAGLAGLAADGRTRLFARKKSLYKRARLRAAIGVLMCSMAVNALAANVSEQEDLRWIAPRIQEVMKQRAQKEADLARRFDALALDQVLLPANLVTKAGRDAGKTKVAAVRNLIAQGTANQQASLDAVEKLMASLRNEKTRRDMRAGMQASLPESTRISEELTRAQYATADAMDEILDSCGAHGSALTVVDQQLIVATQAESDALNVLSDRLNKRMEREQALAAQAEKRQQDGMAMLREAQRRTNAKQ